MSTTFFCLIVGVLVPLFVRSNDLPPLPHTGKFLCGFKLNTTYPDHKTVNRNCHL